MNGQSLENPEQSIGLNDKYSWLLEFYVLETSKVMSGWGQVQNGIRGN